jgi:HAE1 family hydrophobic/amphiphilic exporter-1
MFNAFIKRPVLAIVLSLVTIFLGILSIKLLPTSQFPAVAPPVVMVSASYPGASAKTLTESVIIPIEQAINGAWGMRYMASDATSAGEANVQVIFEPGTDINQALVQSRRASAKPPSSVGTTRRCHHHACNSKHVDVPQLVQHG